MPELPEVETTRRGLAPLLLHQRITAVIVRTPALRQPIPRRLSEKISGATIRAVSRRAKYLLLDCGHGTLIIHLGMSGRLWIVGTDVPVLKHDHFDLLLANGCIVRLRDPRRFGLVLWHEGDPATHPLLVHIGPEPLSAAFNGTYLHQATRNRSAAIKQVLMDSHMVAGVGNIYANEALFRARIDPRLPARRLSRIRCATLVAEVRATLRAAIRAGGSTLRDYVGSDGRAGWFQNDFLVYGRGGEPCRVCATALRELRQGQRATCFCPHCQRR